MNPTPTTSSDDGVPDFVEAEASQSGSASSSQDPSIRIGGKHYQSTRYEDLPKHCKMDILARMRGDVELAQHYYPNLVLNGYNAEEIEEHLSMTDTYMQQKTKEYSHARYLRNFNNKRYPNWEDCRTHRRRVNQWKLEMIDLMKVMNPARFFKWLSWPLKCEIAERIRSDESLLPYYLNNVCGGKSIREIHQHLNSTKFSITAQEWELEHCRRTKLFDQKRQQGATPEQQRRSSRLMFDSRQQLLNIGVSEINKSIKSCQVMRQEVREEIGQVIDLTKENNEFLNTFLCQMGPSAFHAPALASATVAAPATVTAPAAAAITAPVEPSAPTSLSQPQATPQKEEQSQAKTYTGVL